MRTVFGEKKPNADMVRFVVRLLEGLAILLFSHVKAHCRGTRILFEICLN